MENFCEDEMVKPLQSTASDASHVDNAHKATRLPEAAQYVLHSKRDEGWELSMPLIGEGFGTPVVNVSIGSTLIPLFTVGVL